MPARSSDGPSRLQTSENSAAPLPNEVTKTGCICSAKCKKRYWISDNQPERRQKRPPRVFPLRSQLPCHSYPLSLNSLHLREGNSLCPKWVLGGSCMPKAKCAIGVGKKESGSVLKNDLSPDGASSHAGTRPSFLKSCSHSASW